MLKRFKPYNTNEIVIAEADPGATDLPAGVFARIQKRRWKLWYNRFNDTYFVRTGPRDNTWSGPFTMFTGFPFTASFFRDGSLGVGNWLRLSEDFVDSATQRFVVPANSTIRRVTLSCSPFTASTYQIEVYVNGVLQLTQALTSGVLHQNFTVNLPVVQSNQIGVFIRRIAGGGAISDACVQLFAT